MQKCLVPSVYDLENSGLSNNPDQTKSVIHAYVTSKLDGNNALLAGPVDSRKGLKEKLQLVQNAAAKVIKKANKHDHVTQFLRELHWLPISKRIIFKILLLVFKSLNGMGPVYLKELLTFYEPKRDGLRYDPLSLRRPETHLVTYGDRSFRATAAVEWNKLPTTIRSAKTVQQFKKNLKTYLFTVK